MNTSRPSFVTTILLGLLAAGPLAALALVAAPPSWRGPFVPGAVLVATILVIGVLRHALPAGRRPSGPSRGTH